jgi:enoyl-CoA hydratase/carnithine racemase
MEKIKTYQEDGILFIILSSPETLNALSSKMLSELDIILDEIWYMKLKGVIISGEGRAFSAGADISELNSLENIHQAYEYLRRGQRILSKIEKLKYITCAAIDGYALGGGFELALACTFRIATKKSKVGLPEINLGIIPGYGGTQRLTRLVGPQKAKRFIMSGEFISADKAFELGILDDICETREELFDKAKKLILQFEGKNPTALRYISELCNLYSDGFFEDNLKTEALFLRIIDFISICKKQNARVLRKKKKVRK